MKYCQTEDKTHELWSCMMELLRKQLVVINSELKLLTGQCSLLLFRLLLLLLL